MRFPNIFEGDGTWEDTIIRDYPNGTWDQITLALELTHEEDIFRIRYAMRVDPVGRYTHCEIPELTPREIEDIHDFIDRQYHEYALYHGVPTHGR